jgi:hypothetical protein
MSQKEMSIYIGSVPQAVQNQSGLVYVRVKMSLQTRESVKRLPKSINYAKMNILVPYVLIEAEIAWNRTFLW